MLRKRVTHIIAAVTILSLMMGTIVSAAEETSDDNLLLKDAADAEYTSAENVYAVLASDGSFDSAYVIHSFDVTKAGKITSYGDYASMTNLTTPDGIQGQNGVQTFYAEEGKFYYQGNSDKVKLPWKISITYYLNGKQVAAKELAGQSGALEIVVTTTKDPSVNPEFYDNYMLQATFTLDMEKCSNVAAEGAAIAEAGSNKTVIFTGLPGKDTQMRMSADVKEFEMEAVSIAAVPFSMAFEMPDTDEMADGLTQLTDAIRQLDEGVGELQSGMDLLVDNAGTLKDGSGMFAEGINTVSANSAALVDASAQISGALQMIAGNLGSVDMSSIGTLAELPGMLTGLADTLDAVQNGIAVVPETYRQAYGALQNSAASVSGAALTDAELAALETAAVAAQDDGAAMAALSRVKQLNTLVQQLAQAQTAVDGLDMQVQQLAGTLGQISGGLRQQAGALNDQLASQDIVGAMTALQGGLSALAENYTNFHSVLTAYAGGVDTLASSYGQLDRGLNAYLGGVEQAADGTVLLKDGTSQLAVNTENIPEEMQKQIDEFMEDYQFDFTPVSFIDERNASVTSVQFLISTPKIEIPEVEEAEEVEEEDAGFIDRLKSLFQ